MAFGISWINMNKTGLIWYLFDQVLSSVIYQVAFLVLSVLLHKGIEIPVL